MLDPRSRPRRPPPRRRLTGTLESWIELPSGTTRGMGLPSCIMAQWGPEPAWRAVRAGHAFRTRQLGEQAAACDHPHARRLLRFLLERKMGHATRVRLLRTAVAAGVLPNVRLLMPSADVRGDQRTLLRTALAVGNPAILRALLSVPPPRRLSAEIGALAWAADAQDMVRACRHRARIDEIWHHARSAGLVRALVVLAPRVSERRWRRARGLLSPEMAAEGEARRTRRQWAR